MKIEEIKLYVLYKLIIQRDGNNDEIKVISVNYREFIENMVTNIYILKNVKMNDNDIKNQIGIIKEVLRLFESESMITIQKENNLIYINYDNDNLLKLRNQFCIMERHIKNTYQMMDNYDEISLQLIGKFCNMSLESGNINYNNNSSNNYSSNNTNFLMGGSTLLNNNTFMNRYKVKCEKEKEEITSGEEAEDEEEEEDNSEEDDKYEIVMSSDGKKEYRVNMTRWTCTCPAFKFSRYEEPRCKHVYDVYKKKIGNLGQDFLDNMRC